MNSCQLASYLVSQQLYKLFDPEVFFAANNYRNQERPHSHLGLKSTAARQLKNVARKSSEDAISFGCARFVKAWAT